MQRRGPLSMSFWSSFLKDGRPFLVFLSGNPMNVQRVHFVRRIEEKLPGKARPHLVEEP